jgi:VIT1/CCC1 family predicted Fe2+/Mn2+ transporter
MWHDEHHKSHRTGWLRAAVLGANDGIVSTASLILGFVAANAAFENVLMAGIAGLVAGAMSMAAGEYVSVSTQADTEQADLAIERRELELNPENEHAELTAIYVQRGLDQELASAVATQLTEHDALGAHARDELGLNEILAAKPLQAALTSAVTFTIGAALPIIILILFPSSWLLLAIPVSSLIFLALLGSMSAYSGGAALLPASLRVTFWGALAMAITAGVGALLGVSV